MIKGGISWEERAIVECWRWNEMKRRYKIAIFFAIIIILSPIWLSSYNEIADEYADPSYNPGVVSPVYSGGYFLFHVNAEFPESYLIMTKYSDNRTLVIEEPLRSDEWNWECSIGGKYWWKVQEVPLGPDIYEKWKINIEWWVRNYTLVVYDWTWTVYNGTHWIEEVAWDYEYVNDVLVYNGSISWENYTITLFDYSLTLQAEWRGYI